MSSLSSSIFALCCFLVVTTELGTKTYLEMIPNLRDWWGSVKHPKTLADKARVTCEIEGLEHVETGEIPSIRYCTGNILEDHEIQVSEPPTNSSKHSLLLYHDEILGAHGFIRRQLLWSARTWPLTAHITSACHRKSQANSCKLCSSIGSLMI